MVPLDSESIHKCFEEAELARISLNDINLEIEFREVIGAIAARALDDPGDFSALKELEKAVKIAQLLPFEVNLWKTQNICYRLATEFYRINRLAYAEENHERVSRSDLVTSILEGLGILVNPSKIRQN